MKWILGVLMLSTAAWAGVAYETGDVDHSGVVDCADVEAILSFVATLDSSVLDVALADISGNGTVTAYDAALLAQRVGPCDPTAVLPMRTLAELKRRHL